MLSVTLLDNWNVLIPWDQQLWSLMMGDLKMKVYYRYDALYDIGNKPTWIKSFLYKGRKFVVRKIWNKLTQELV